MWLRLSKLLTTLLEIWMNENKYIFLNGKHRITLQNGQWQRLQIPADLEERSSPVRGHQGRKLLSPSYPHPA